MKKKTASYKLTTMKLSFPETAAECTHLVIAWDLEGALCLLHFVGRGDRVAEFKYKGQTSGLDWTAFKAEEKILKEVVVFYKFRLSF